VIEAACIALVAAAIVLVVARKDIDAMFQRRRRRANKEAGDR
jgi:hypothetical protein